MLHLFAQTRKMHHLKNSSANLRSPAQTCYLLLIALLLLLTLLDLYFFYWVVSLIVHFFYYSMRPTILTLWEDFADADGSILAAQVAEYPIIVAKRITRTNYAGLSLSTRYNSVILINSPYPQVGRLLNWVRDNRPRLMRYSQQNSLAVDWSLVPAAEHNDTVPIADIQSQPHIQLFYVEGKLSLPTHDQDFYELLCSHCGRQYRTHSPKIIHCASCKQRTMLTSGTTITS
ncbi:replication protein A 70 kDa DNA-binding subunit B-like isoform X1 [Nicotiana tabacum]|uniref:Replication protein A 70 kDa DNA-binding subunit B-like isoform X1 n=2 Tax=Nicotiana tabacum TaxID=4097 RepID=A0AC58T9R2_TOBAC